VTDGEIGERYPELLLDEAQDVDLANFTLGFATGGPQSAALSENPQDDLELSQLDGASAFALIDLGTSEAEGFVVSASMVGIGRDGGRIVSPPLARLCVGSRRPELRLETPLVSADAVSPVGDMLGPRGAWLRVRVRNGTMAASIASAVLRLERTPHLGKEPKYPTPVVLLPGETGVLQAWLSEADARVVAGTHGEIQGVVFFLDAETDQYVSSQPIRLTRQDVLDASLAIRPHLPTLAGDGRRVRAPWRLTNDGGQTWKLTGMRLVLLPVGAASVCIEVGEADNIGAPSYEAVAIQPGQVCEGEIRVKLPELPVGQEMDGRIEASVVGVVDGAASLSQPFTLEVRPANHPFVGRICLDFGTTESAASAATGRRPSHVDDRVKPPFMVDLGRVGVDRPGSGSRFLPSQAVVLRNGEILFGQDIHNAPPHRVQRTVENFKWMLRKHPETSEDRLANQIVAEYLSRIKCLIEEHPDIAGVVGASTTVLATCPTQFPPSMRARLAEAMLAAGFPDPRTTVFDHRHDGSSILIAESWSPLPFALYDDPELFASLGVGPAPKRQALALESGQVGHAIVLDIGGGSADVSTLRIARSNDGFDISQVHRKTNKKFVGRAFSTEIEESFRAWWRQTNLVDASVDQETLVRSFQYADGVFGDNVIAEVLEAHFELRLKGEAGPDEDETALRPRFMPEGSNRRDRLNSHFERMSPLRLGAAGRGVELSKEALIDFCSHILVDFTKRHLSSLDGIVKAAVDKATETSGPVFLIPSGRGAAYPLARRLIMQAWRRHAGTASLCGLDPLEAKSITSWGGLYLADLATAGENFTIELSDDQCVLLWAGRSGSSDHANRYDPVPWLENPPKNRRIAIAQLSSLNRRVLQRQSLVVCYGDPDPDLDEAPDQLGEAPIPPAAVDRPSDHWLVVELNHDSEPTLGPIVVAAHDKASAINKARRQRR